MKTNRWLGLVTAWVLPLISVYSQTPVPGPPGPDQAPAPAVAQVNLSYAVNEVLRLAEAGNGEDVIVAYIQNSTSPFNLTADQILYLRDNGISSTEITAMLNRDNALRSQNVAYSYDQKLYAPAAQPQVAPAPIAPATAEPAAPPPMAEPAQAAPAPVYVSNPPPDVAYFYNDLSPYGTWVQLDGGWCWQPRVVIVNRVWRPYCDGGQWVYTDAGWFWQSDYSWGWAPFHYGRWHLHPRCGWVWYPDRVWAPAWVVWRSEGDHCGWAPVPPHAVFDVRLGWCFNGVQVGLNFDFGLHPEHFTFIAVQDFHRHDYAHCSLPPTQVTKIYNHTTIINNYTIVNNTVVNHGIKPEHVAAVTHTKVETVHIRDLPPGSPSPANLHAGAHGELAVYRPQLKAPAKPVTMVAQKVDDHHPVIQHTSIAPGRSEHATGPGNSASAPAYGNRGSQGEFSRTPRPGTNPQDHTRPNSYPLAPPANRNQEQPKQPAHTTTAYQSAAPAPSYTRQHSGETGPTSPRPSPTPSGEQNSHLYPLQTRPQVPANSAPAQSENPSIYYPKGYHQAAEAHALPPVNQQQSDHTAASSGQNHGQSKKHDQ